MPFGWSGKKERGADAAQAPVAAGDGGELHELAGHLDRLGQLWAETNQRIGAYLLQRESGAADEGAAADLGAKLDQLSDKLERFAQSAPATSQGTDSGRSPIQPVLDRLDALEARLSAGAGSPTAPATAGASEAPLAEILDGLNQQKLSFSEGMRRLGVQIDDGLARLAEQLAPPQEEEQSGGPASYADWERAILGRSLSEHPALDFQRRQLVQGVLEGNLAACAFAGQLLVFQSAPDERLPQLLKDVGEGYYRWQPKTRPGTGPFEQALVEWLQSTCEAAGIGNTIELVHPGERFDAGRHSASSRGVEITEVHGWIVLRDNGKVYTKASVAVR
jgi:hypothetical protein